MSRIRYRTTDELRAVAPDIYGYFIEQRKKQPSATHLLIGNAPNLLRPFLGLADAVQQTSLDKRLRELVQMMVCYICGKDYVWTHHYEKALRLGITPEQLQTLGEFETSPHFSQEERILLRYTLEALNLDVADETFEAVRALLQSDEAVMELVLSVAFFNFSTYVHLPCQIDIEPAYRDVPRVTELPGWVPLVGEREKGSRDSNRKD